MGLVSEVLSPVRDVSWVVEVSRGWGGELDGEPPFLRECQLAELPPVAEKRAARGGERF